jgi:hypothetical protein
MCAEGNADDENKRKDGVFYNVSIGRVFCDDERDERWRQREAMRKRFPKTVFSTFQKGEGLEEVYSS